MDRAREAGDSCRYARLRRASVDPVIKHARGVRTRAGRSAGLVQSSDAVLGLTPQALC